MQPGWRPGVLFGLASSTDVRPVLEALVAASGKPRAGSGPGSELMQMMVAALDAASDRAVDDWKGELLCCRKPAGEPPIQASSVPVL